MKAATRGAFLAPEPGPLVRRDRLILAGVVLAAFVLRLVYVWQYRSSPTFDLPQMDAFYHAEWARAFARGESYMEGQPYFRAPLYPWFLGICFRVFGEDYLVPRVLQSAMGALGCGLVFLIGRRLFGRPTGALAAAVAATCWLPIYFEAELLITALAVFLDLIFLWLLLRAGDTGTRGAFFVSGLAMGVSAIARPNILLFGPFVCAWIALSIGWKSGKAWLRASLFALACLLPILPIAIRNHVDGNDRVLISSQGGVNFYIGNNPDSDGIRAVVPGTRPGWFEGYRDSIAMAERDEGRQLKASEVSRYFFRRAFLFIEDDTGAWLRLTGEKIRYFWNASEFPNNQPIRFFAERFAPVSRILSLGFVHGFGTIAPFGLLGLFLSFRYCGRLFPLWGFTAAYSASVILFFVCTRFKVPVMPVLIILACAAVRWLLLAFLHRRWVPAGLGSAALIPLFWLVNATPGGFGDTAYQGPMTLANVEFIRGNLDGAIEQLRTGVGLAPDHARMRTQLGEAMIRKGKAEAEEFLRRGRRAEAEAARWKWFDGAEEELRAALASRQRHAEESWGVAAFWLGWVAAERGQTDRAIQLYSRSLHLDPDRAETHHQLARLLAGKQRQRKALRLMRRALEIEPGSVPVRISIADVLEEMGRDEKAAAELERALAILSPGDPRTGRIEERIRLLRSR
jgi:4-amino-4-deoxy-L-arabinose transferase-like glycosyltransferase